MSTDMESNKHYEPQNQQVEEHIQNGDREQLIRVRNNTKKNLLIFNRVLLK